MQVTSSQEDTGATSAKSDSPVRTAIEVSLTSVDQNTGTPAANVTTSMKEVSQNLSPKHAVNCRNNVGQLDSSTVSSIKLRLSGLKISGIFRIYDSFTNLYYRISPKDRRAPPHWFWDRVPKGMFLFFLALNVVLCGLGVAQAVVGGLNLSDDRELRVLLHVGLWGDLKTDSSMGVIQWSELLLLLTGILGVLQSVLGFASVLQSNNKILHAYFVLVLLSIAATTIVIAFSLKYQLELDQAVGEPLKRALSANYNGVLNSTNAISRAFDNAHVLLGCCGATSYKDFLLTPWWSRRVRIPLVQQNNDTRHNNSQDGVLAAFPLTCCRMRDPAAFVRDPVSFNFTAGVWDPQCPFRVASSDNAFTGTPCEKPMQDELLSRSTTLYYLALVALTVYLISFACACSMAEGFGSSHQL